MSSVVTISIDPHYNTVRRATPTEAAEENDGELREPFTIGSLHQTRMSFYWQPSSSNGCLVCAKLVACCLISTSQKPPLELALLGCVEGPGRAEPRAGAPFSSLKAVLPGQGNHAGVRSRSSLVVPAPCWTSLMDCQPLLPLLQAFHCRKEHNAALKGLVWKLVENGNVVLKGELESVLTHSGTSWIFRSQIAVVCVVIAPGNVLQNLTCLPCSRFLWVNIKEEGKQFFPKGKTWMRFVMHVAQTERKVQVHMTLLFHGGETLS